MSRNRTSNTKATYKRKVYTENTWENDEYIYGNTVRKVQPKKQERVLEEVIESPQYEARRNREKAHRMSFGYVLFLVAAMSAFVYILVNYVQMEAELTELTKTVAAQESRLNTMKSNNDEMYSRILNSVDLEEVRRIATEELGMVYAKEGQVVVYESEGNDYMRQVTNGNQ